MQICDLHQESGKPPRQCESLLAHVRDISFRLVVISTLIISLLPSCALLTLVQEPELAVVVL